MAALKVAPAMPGRMGARWRRSSCISLAVSEAFALSVTETGSYSASTVCRAKAQDYPAACGSSCSARDMGLHYTIPFSDRACICRHSGRPHKTSTLPVVDRTQKLELDVRKVRAFGDRAYDHGAPAEALQTHHL